MTDAPEASPADESVGRQFWISLNGDVSREHPIEDAIAKAVHNLADKYGILVTCGSGPLYDDGDEQDRTIAALTAERDQLLREVDGWKKRFCPKGMHYKGSALQSRLNPETGKLEPSTHETYRCWQCDRDKKISECAHSGDISPMPMAFGLGWACADCGYYFASRGFNLPRDEALAAIRASLAAKENPE